VAATLIHDPVLARFRAALDDIYDDQIERVVLFGSRARGDAGADSDYDVAVFLKDLPDRFAELYRLTDLSTDIWARPVNLCMPGPIVPMLTKNARR
jgi:predicted nucleotidyltransferase